MYVCYTKKNDAEDYSFSPAKNRYISISMIIKEKIKKEDIRAPFTKGVVDIELRRIALGEEFHRDCGDELADDGSNWKNIWGFNIYPDGKLDFV